MGQPITNRPEDNYRVVTESSSVESRVQEEYRVLPPPVRQHDHGTSFDGKVVLSGHIETTADIETVERTIVPVDT